MNNGLSSTNDARLAAAAPDVLRLDPAFLTWELGPDLTVRHASPAAARSLLGTTPEEVQGRALRDLAPAAMVERMGNILAMVRAANGPVIGKSVWGGHRYRTVFVPADHGGMTALTRRDPSCLGSHAESDIPIDEASFVELGELDQLSSRELEVLALLGEGLRIKEIAERLGRSYKTASSIRDRLGRKLGITDRCELVSMARSRGLERQHASMPRITRSRVAASA